MPFLQNYGIAVVRKGKTGKEDGRKIYGNNVQERYF